MGSSGQSSLGRITVDLPRAGSLLSIPLIPIIREDNSGLNYWQATALPRRTNVSDSGGQMRRFVSSTFCGAPKTSPSFYPIPRTRLFRTRCYSRGSSDSSPERKSPRPLAKAELDEHELQNRADR